ncbi:hypothetical protein Vsou_09080 [Vulcanisaeta souniana JCM 11219]|nr:hypothetical protein Vsou_09080 [Vulcanisaeta souniana JCM 11219]
MRLWFLVFHAEPRDLVFNRNAVIGAAEVWVDVGNCLVGVGGVDYVVVGVGVLSKLVDAAREGFRARTAYPPMLMNSTSYFLAKLGLPRYMYKVIAADPWVVPFKAVGDLGLVRNIAYLHGILELVRGWGRVGRKTSYTIHALLRASGYNADEGLASRARLPMPCRLRLT